MIEIFEKKGTIRILLLLYEKEGRHYSKYELAKASELNMKTVDNRLRLLESLKLVRETPEVGPRARTEIAITPKGKEVAKLLIQIKEKISEK